ncbi:MAG: hypothetical protein MR933_09825 [Prevotella sp.]|uniref:hypothetical protein n=1 Tax=Prevotella sp. TaxID=59823 RepID=UPI0025F95363|nr:hypothetical protein [Prevotella sp.]MCI7120062.1 hypothetical protein [Prevotella sp.]
MKNDSNKSKMLVCLLSCGLLTLGTGCTDNDFDLSKIDTTIGIGGNGLTLPTNSTENIMLDDFLELNNSDLVSIADNGDYMFHKEGDDCTPAHPNIDKVVVTSQGINNNFKVAVVVPPSALLSGRKLSKRAKKIDLIKAGGKVAEFEYVGNAPKEIEDLTSAGVAAPVTIRVNLSNDLKSFVPKFKELTLQIPSYMHLDITSCSPNSYSYDPKTGKITLKDVNTASDIVIKGEVTTLDFKATPTTNNKLTFVANKKNEGKVNMKGEIETSISFDEINANVTSIPSDLHLSAVMSMDDITITSAKGKFNPDIDLGNLGNIEINDVPDFLTGDEVNVNLHNPVIELKIGSDIAVTGKVSGTIVATFDNGKPNRSVDIPKMTIKPNANTRICICKHKEGVDATNYDEVVEVPNLSDIFATIPKTIKFNADASADATQEAEVKLGHQYTITPKYNITAPLAFDAGANISYTDSFDGWNEDIEDCEFAEGTYIELTADIENKLPAYLDVNADAIDVDGNKMSQDLIEVKVSNSIAASTDGVQAKTTPIIITLREKKSGMLKKVDGLKYNIKLAAGEGNDAIVGKTINAYHHTITAKNIKVKLVGKIIADFN